MKKQTLTHSPDRYETLAKWVREAKAINRDLRNMADDKTGIKKLHNENHFRCELQERKNNLLALAAAANLMVDEINECENTWIADKDDADEMLADLRQYRLEVMFKNLLNK